MGINLKYRLFLLFIIITILVDIGLTLQYNKSKQSHIETFKNKQYIKTLHIRENFRLLFDKIQYDFRKVELQNIQKLNYLYEKYKQSNGKLDIEKTVKELNSDISYGEYQIFLINQNYIVNPEKLNISLF